MSLKTLTLLFFSLTSYGVIASLGLVKVAAVGTRYYVSTALQVFGVGVLLLIFFQEGLSGLAIACYCSFLIASLGASFARGRRYDGLFWPLFGIAMLSGLGFFYHECLNHFDIEAAMVAGLGSFVFDRVQSGLFLGVTLSAMLLGHWYLTQPKMPIEELKRITACFLGLVVIRILTVSIFGWRWIAISEETDTLKLLVGTSSGLFLMMRWLWGLLLPAVLGAMVWQTVKIRSTQSATGILYVCTLAVFTGELLGLYLTLTERIPL